MNIKEFRKIISQREYVEKVSYGEWAEGIEECQKKEIQILSKNIDSTIDFLNNDCTAKEYSWISEILDDLIEKTRSRDLLECYKSLQNKFPEEFKTYYIEGSVESAETILKRENL